MTSLNIEQIKELIPHRYPFLLIDKVVDIIPFESATGIKNVTFNENYFQGHFESKSVMPGALIIESMAQSAGTLVLYSLKETNPKLSVYLLTIDKAKFRKPVCPGDTLFNKVVKKQNVKNIWKFSCNSYVNETLVAQAEVSAILNTD
jgi:3-hydroxyacyl-[acyl-carrier-protein] dehydratase